MKHYVYWTGALFAAFSTVIFYYPTAFYLFLMALYTLVIIIITIFGTVYVHFLLNSKCRPHSSSVSTNILYNATRSNLCSPAVPKKNGNNLPVLFGRSVDVVLQQIIENTLRDFVTFWLTHLVRVPKDYLDQIKDDIWSGIRKVRDRGAKIDTAKMIAVDMVVRVTVHFEKIRTAKARSLESGNAPIFATSSYLATEEREIDFLKKLCEVVLIFLLPRGYSFSPTKDLLCEMLACKIIYPIIKMITSPDYINQKIIQYIQTRLAVNAINKRSFEYAASFEEFLKIIANSNTSEELISMRTSILNDILQATTMQNLQRSKGVYIDGDEKTLTKGELATAFKLKRYIQQLSFAKVQCEKCLVKIGWEGNYSNDLNLSISDILATVIGRRNLILFLEPLKASALVGFYTSVEELKHSPKSSWHQLGAELFYTYICSSSEIAIDKKNRKKIEQFLLGDASPDVFYDIQKSILKSLEEKYYAPFLMSAQYQQLKNSITTDDIKDLASGVYPDNHDENNSANTDQDISMDLANHSCYARNKLDQLQEKLKNKNQALNALSNSLKPENKVLTFLEKEVDWLKCEKRQLEAHLSRTEIWAEYLGKWRSVVQSVDATEEKESLQFVLLVQTDEDTKLTHQEIDNDNISTGWVVLRSLSQFQELHKKLRPLCAELKSVDLPSNTFKLFFMKNDKTSLEKAKRQIQKYLDFILSDEQIYQSEVLYAFLSPSSDHLKQITPSPKKQKFSLSTLFKGNTTSDANRLDPFWNVNNLKDGEEDMAIYLDGNETESNHKAQFDLDGKDSIAEPLYALLGEIFDMGGVFKWLRRSLISFVQITYGRTINRQIRESLNYLFDESMLHYYASSALKSFWPAGVLSTTYFERTEDMKEMTENAAKALFTDNIPEMLCSIVGAQTAKYGAEKVFDNIQNPVYNKQLFYELLEILMADLFPEIKQLKPVKQSRAFN